MKNLDIDICYRIKAARKEQGISQSVLAAAVGCKQSALSMFEQGDPTKLNGEVVDKLAKKFGIDLSAPVKPEVPQVTVHAEHHSGMCPNPACPSHTRYQVEGRTLLRPDWTQTDPVGGRFCAVCGEVLERFCPNCHAPLHPGAVCSFCGEPYIPLLS